MSKNKRLIAIMMGLMFILGTIIPVYASELEEAQRKLQDINQKINAQQANINAARQKQRSVSQEIATLDQSIKYTEDRINALNKDISQLEKEIERTQGRKSAARKRNWTSRWRSSRKGWYMYTNRADRLLIWRFC